MNKRADRILVLLAVSVVALAGILVACSSAAPAPAPNSNAPAPAAQAKVIKWRGQHYQATTVAPYGPFPAGYAGIGSIMVHYVDWLQKASGGRLQIEMAEPGAIFPVQEAFDGVQKGVVDLAFSSGSFHVGKLAESSLETLPFLWDNSAQEYDLYYNWGMYNGLKAVYASKGLNWFPVHSNALVGVGTTFSAPNPEALKGKKIRAVGEMGSYMNMLGASPVSIPWGEAYMAMKLGTVDGFVGGSGILEEQKLKEVLKYWIDKPIPYRATVNLLINPDSYAALPQDLQDLIERDSRYVLTTLALDWEQQCNWALSQARKQYGMTVQSWSDADIKKVRKMAMDQIWPAVAAKSAKSAELIELAKKQLKEYGTID